MGDPNDYYAKDAAPNAQEIASLVITRGGETVSAVYYEDGAPSSYTSSYAWEVSDGTTAVAADASALSDVLTAVNSVSWASVVDPTYDGAVDYGFGAPTLTAQLTYTDPESSSSGDESDGEASQVTFTLVVGSQTADGSYYAQPEGSGKVYTLAASTVETLLGASPEALRPDDVVLMDWDSVTSVDLSCGDDIYLYSGVTSW